MQGKVRTRKQQGGVLAEAAIAIVFLFGALVWLVELGRLTRNVVTLPQLTYDLSVDSATTHPKLRDKLVEEKFNKLFPVQNEGLKDETVTIVPDQLNATLAIRIQASLTPLIQNFGLAIGRKIVIPILFEKIVSMPPIFASFGTGVACSCNSGSTCPDVFALDNCPDYKLIPVPPPGTTHSCFSGETLIAIDDHKSKPIAKLQIGDTVLSADPINHIQSPNLVTAKIVRSAANYYLLNGELKVTSEHPFWVGSEWRKVKDLRLGDKLTGINGQPITLFSKEFVNSEITVFNITVDRAHTYYAGGMLVHNKGSLFNVYDSGQGCEMYGYPC